jgi:hypothetical protein
MEIETYCNVKNVLQFSFRSDNVLYHVHLNRTDMSERFIEQVKLGFGL